LLGILLVVTVVAAVAVSRGAPAGAARKPLVAKPKPTEVVATDPASGAVGVVPTTTLVVKLSRPVAASVPPPTLSPPVAGSWAGCGTDELCFTPTAPFPAGVTESLVVPLSVRSVGRRATAAHRRTRSAATDASDRKTVVSREFHLSFTAAAQSTGLAQVLLAQLGYLPLHLAQQLVPVAGAKPGHGASTASQDPVSAATTGVPESATGSGASSTSEGSDPAAALTFRYSDIPPAVQAMWQPGVDNTMTQGALVQFERVHGIEDGSYPPYGTTVTPTVWQALVQASLTAAHDPDPYSVAEVSESSPEQLVLWSNGTTALTTLVNTGIVGGATPTGDYFVYLRYPEQTMHGYTTTGQPYVYRDVPDVNYFSGNFAIHGFQRASYGFPQSQGCVEVPLNEAPVIYSYLHYGSLVVIS